MRLSTPERRARSCRWGGALLLSFTPALASAHAATGAAGWAQVPVWLSHALFAIGALTYLAGALRRRPRSGARLAFVAAMLVTGLALFGPLDAWAQRSSAWHMVQHMLLIVVAAPLAVLARPLPQWRAVLGPAVDALWRRVHRLSRRPMLCALLHAAAIWFWHAPGPYVAALQHPGWHVLEHACLLFSAWLFWWAVLHPGRAAVLPAAMALLFTVMHTGLLGALLTFASVPLYDHGPAALAEQQLAGLVMWIPGGLVYLLAAVRAAWRGLAKADAGRNVQPPLGQRSAASHTVGASSQDAT